MECEMRRVLDASALRSGASSEGDLYPPPEAVAEVHRLGSPPQLDAVLATKVRVLTPSKESLESVDEEARRTGDIARLSPTDRGLLALARDLGATILTDDYSIQNVAARLGVPYERVLERGIREAVQWRDPCAGCRAVSGERGKEAPGGGSRG